jgi:hypothetical protein
MGLKAALCCGEAREGFPQPAPLFGQPYPHDLFAVHIFLLPLAAGLTPNTAHHLPPCSVSVMSGTPIASPIRAVDGDAVPQAEVDLRVGGVLPHHHARA